MRVFIFESTRAVIRAEKAVRAEDLECTVIPVPRSISPYCGMALQTKNSDEAAIRDMLEGLDIKIDVYDRDEVVL